MKKISLPLIAVAIIGVASAFTTTSKIDPVYVRDAELNFHLYSEVQDEGQCENRADFECEFDAQQQPINPGEDRVWVEN